MADTSSFHDLLPRLLTALALLVIGGACLWLGGWYFLFFLAVMGGAMVWETFRMHGGAPWEAILSGLIFLQIALLVFLNKDMIALLILGALIAWFALRLKGRHRIVAPVALICVFITVLTFGHLRSDIGLIATIWVIGCVVASDLGGYFAGRLIGGPKFWPAVSPKKTWSGVLGGWALAAALSAVFVAFGFGTEWLIPMGVLVGFASQLGDLAESWMKRRAGIKDASHILPGHGGVFDRFDGVVGAAMPIAALLVLGLIP